MNSELFLEGVSTITELVEKRAREQPSRLAYCFLERGEPGARLTYQALKETSDAVASALFSLGAPGERVLLAFPPGLAFVRAFFGTIRADAAAVPVPSPDRRGLAKSVQRIEAVAENCSARILLTTPALLESKPEVCRLAPGLERLHWLAVEEDAVTQNESPSALPPPLSDGNSLALLQYTSGSTAAPRGVMVSHCNLLTNCALVRRAFEQNEDCVLVSWLPMHHDMGLIGCLLQPLYCGYPDYLMSPTEFIKQPVRWLRAISKYRATISGGPNFAYDLCVRTVTDEQRRELDLSSWRVAFCGSEPVHAKTLARFSDAFREQGFQARHLYPCYGLAEATLIVSGGPKQDPPKVMHVDEAALAQHAVDPVGVEQGRALVSCGHIDEVQDVRIVDPDRLVAVSPGAVGEIWIRGPSVAGGYWNQPELNHDLFGARTCDGEGPFLRTGDLGFVRESELYVCGRIKDVIIVRGKNHYPQDIEQTVQETLPGLRVGGAVAFAVAEGEQESVVVVVEASPAMLKQVNGSDWQGRIREAIFADHNLKLSDVVLTKQGTIRRTTSGKLARSACRADYLAQKESPS